MKRILILVASIAIMIDISAQSIAYADGVAGIDPVTLQISQAYTVPAGKNLYINHIQMRDDADGRITVDGKIVFRTKSNNQRGRAINQLQQPIIVGGGSVVTTEGDSNTPLRDEDTRSINGFLVDACVVPMTVDMSADYTAPANMVITSYYAYEKFDPLLIDGIDVVHGFSNRSTGINGFSLGLPIAVAAGQVISADNGDDLGPATINGYVIDDNCGGGAGGGGSTTITHDVTVTDTLNANGDIIGFVVCVDINGVEDCEGHLYPECKPDLVDDADADPGNELQTLTESNGTVTLSDGGGEFELPVSTLTETSNGDGTTTYTHTAGAVTTTFCAIDKNLPPTFAVDFVEPEVESCTGAFDLSEGGDTECVYGQTLYTLTSIPDGYFAAVDAVSGVVTFSKIHDCGDCNCEAETLMFEYDLVSECGTVSANHIVPINPPPTGDLIVSKEMNFVDVPDGETPTQIEIAICATNDPNATGNLVAVTLTDNLDPAFFSNVTSTDPNITIAGNTVTLNATGINLARGDQLCGVYIADAVFPNTHFPNIVSGEATDESAGTSTDSAPEVLPAIPVPEARLEWADVNGANGTVTTASQSYVKTDGAPVADGEPFRMEVKLEDGTLWETITGTLNGGDYTSDRTDGLSILDFSPTGDFGNGSSFGFNKRAWADASENNYRAILDNITDTSDVAARTNAQELETAIYVGGQGSTTCPIESINPDNVSTICKVIAYWNAEIRTNAALLLPDLSYGFEISGTRNGYQGDNLSNYAQFTYTSIPALTNRTDTYTTSAFGNTPNELLTVNFSYPSVDTEYTGRVDVEMNNGLKGFNEFDSFLQGGATLDSRGGNLLHRTFKARSRGDSCNGVDRAISPSTGANNNFGNAGNIVQTQTVNFIDYSGSTTGLNNVSYPNVITGNESGSQRSILTQVGIYKETGLYEVLIDRPDIPLIHQKIKTAKFEHDTEVNYAY